jgi:hypothetical protein
MRNVSSIAVQHAQDLNATQYTMLQVQYKSLVPGPLEVKNSVRAIGPQLDVPVAAGFAKL